MMPCERIFRKSTGRIRRLTESCSICATATRGIRGEAQKGFPSVRTLSLPAMRTAFSAGQTENEAYLNTLLTLMANVDDTNVLSRTNTVTQGYVKSESSLLLKMGGASTQQGNGGSEKAESEIYHLNVSPAAAPIFWLSPYCCTVWKTVYNNSLYTRNTFSEKDCFDLSGGKAFTAHLICQELHSGAVFHFNRTSKSVKI